MFKGCKGNLSICICNNDNSFNKSLRVYPANWLIGTLQFESNGLSLIMKCNFMVRREKPESLGKNVPSVTKQKLAKSTNTQPHDSPP